MGSDDAWPLVSLLDSFPDALYPAVSRPVGRLPVTNGGDGSVGSPGGEEAAPGVVMCRGQPVGYEGAYIVGGEGLAGGG